MNGYGESLRSAASDFTRGWQGETADPSTRWQGTGRIHDPQALLHPMGIGMRRSANTRSGSTASRAWNGSKRLDPHDRAVLHNPDFPSPWSASRVFKVSGGSPATSRSPWRSTLACADREGDGYHPLWRHGTGVHLARPAPTHPAAKAFRCPNHLRTPWQSHARQIHRLVQG